MGSSSDTGFWIAVIVSVVIHAGGAFVYYRMAQGQTTTLRAPDNITAAVLVRKGKPRDKRLLPRIFQKKPKTRPKRRIVKRKKRKKRRRRRISDDELMKRAQKRIEEMKRRMRKEEYDPRAEDGEKPGQANGTADGTAATAKLGNIYLGKIRSKIERNMEFPSILSQAQIQACRQRIQVMMYLQRDGRLVGSRLRILRTGGDRRCDNAVMAAVRRSSPFSSPPNKLWAAVKQGIIVQLSQ